MEFHTTTGVIRDYTVWPDLQRVQYLLLDPLTLNRNGNQGKDLVRSVTRNLLGDLEEIPDDQRLLSGVHSLGILYYDGEIWVDTWDSEQQDPAVPKAVRVTIGLMPEQEPKYRERLPIELVVPISVKTFNTESEEDEGGEESTDGGEGNGEGGSR